MRLFSGSAPTDKPTRAQRGVQLAIFVSVVLAGIFAYGAIAQLTQQHTLKEVTAVRNQAAKVIEDVLAQKKQQFQYVLSQPDVQSALAVNDRTKIEDAVRRGVQGAIKVVINDDDLGEIHENVQTFGYGRLGVIEAAAAANTVLLTIVNEDHAVRIGMAAPVHLGQGDGSVYVSLPTHDLNTKFAAIAVPTHGYIGLRQGAYTVFETGQTELRAFADTMAKPLEESAFRVVAAAPLPTLGPLGCGITACFFWMALFFVAALVMLSLTFNRKTFFSRYAHKQIDDDENQLTLRNSLQKNNQDAVATHADDLSSDAIDVGDVSQITVPRHLFHESGIQGLFGQDLTAGVSLLIGRALGTYLIQRQQKGAVIGFDGRRHGSALKASLLQGLRDTGCDVTDLGVVTTPIAQFAAQQYGFDCSINVTGSNLAADYNGFKIRIDKQILVDDTLLAVYQLIQTDRLQLAEKQGELRRIDCSDQYLQYMTDSVQLSRSLKVVVNCCNGSASDIAPRVFTAIGAEVVPSHCQLGEPFPHRIPNPFAHDAIQETKLTVEKEQADIGLIFDGDASCFSVIVPGKGLLQSDRVLMLFTQDVLQRHPGTVIMYDLLSSQALTGFILQHGGRPLMWLPDPSKCLEKMHQSNAVLAGGSHGHYFFREHLNGGDDALYAAARLLEIVAQQEKSVEELCAVFPDNTQRAVYSLPAPSNIQPDEFIKKVIVMSQDGALGVGPFASTRVSTIDGIRIDFQDGWLLLRESIKNPKKIMLELRLEALDKSAFDRIQSIIRDVLSQLLPSDYSMPF